MWSTPRVRRGVREPCPASDQPIRLLALATQLVLEEVLGLIDLGCVLTTSLTVNEVTDHVDPLINLSFVALYGTLDLFDDVHSASFLSWAAERFSAAQLL